MLSGVLSISAFMYATRCIFKAIRCRALVPDHITTYVKHYVGSSTYTKYRYGVMGGVQGTIQEYNMACLGVDGVIDMYHVKKDTYTYYGMPDSTDYRSRITDTNELTKLINDRGLSVYGNLYYLETEKLWSYNKNDITETMIEKSGNYNVTAAWSFLLSFICVVIYLSNKTPREPGYDHKPKYRRESKRRVL